MFATGSVLLEKYRVERELGRGGMAYVVAATHLHLQEQVAIKMLLPELAANAGVVQRFMREARAAVRLKGEHVARVLDVGTLPTGIPYMVMELLVGLDLAELLKQRGRLPSGEAVDILLQVCEALAESHHAGIVHRDIKPANLFITRRPDGSQLVKVLDFGISKAGFDEHINLTQDSMVGTPSYMSPEQLRGSAHVDARTDIWSLGIVLYRLLAGVRPFQADSVSALAIQAVNDPTPPIAVALPPGLDAIVYRCLEKDPARRIQTVAELAYVLAPYAADARAASVIIERTQGIQRWSPLALTAPPPSPPSPHAEHPSHSASARPPIGEPTTLGSSAGSVRTTPASSGRRSLVIVLSAAAVIGVMIAILAGTGRERIASPSAPLQPTNEPSAAPEPPAAPEPARPAPMQSSEPTPSAPPTIPPSAEPTAEPTVGEPVADDVDADPAETATTKPVRRVRPTKPKTKKDAPKRIKREPATPTRTEPPRPARSNPLDSRT